MLRKIVVSACMMAALSVGSFQLVSAEFCEQPCLQARAAAYANCQNWLPTYPAKYNQCMAQANANYQACIVSCF